MPSLIVKSDRPSWDDYHFGQAKQAADRSPCVRAQIGCVIVDRRTHRLIGTGYNGPPPGEIHCVDRGGCVMFAGHDVVSVHAEINAINSAWYIISTGAGWLDALEPEAGFLNPFDAVAYIHGPRLICSHCARGMWLAGVQDVFTNTSRIGRRVPDVSGDGG